MILSIFVTGKWNDHFEIMECETIVADPQEQKRF